MNSCRRRQLLADAAIAVSRVGGAGKPHQGALTEPEKREKGYATHTTPTALAPKRRQQGLAMILTAAERQLIRIIRTAGGHDLTLTVRVRDGHHTMRITTYDDGGPGAGIGYGESFDAAWRDVTELSAQRAG